MAVSERPQTYSTSYSLAAVNPGGAAMEIRQLREGDKGKCKGAFCGIKHPHGRQLPSVPMNYSQKVINLLRTFFFNTYRPYMSSAKTAVYKEKDIICVTGTCHVQRSVIGICPVRRSANQAIPQLLVSNNYCFYGDSSETLIKRF